MKFEDLDSSALTNSVSFDDHETVRRFDLDGTIAFIAVHNTNIGPSLGGCRMRAYGSEEEAINDVLRLSRGMTYKNAMAGLPLGGGKSVIIGNHRSDKTPELMERMGEAVQSLEGRYIIAEDSGTGEEDMVTMSKSTSFVCGLPPEDPENSLGGNPSPVTAWGVYHGIKAAAEQRFGSDSLIGMKVAVQGVGAVGFTLCEWLHKEGAELIVSDIDQDQLNKASDAFPGVQVVALDDIYAADAEVFAPCALGAILNDQTIPQLKAGIVAGAANNQLLTKEHDQQLAERNILYVPDYVINAGGVICVAYEYFKASGYNPRSFTLTRDGMMDHVSQIGGSVTDILGFAKSKEKDPGAAADAFAEEKFQGASNLRSAASSA